MKPPVRFGVASKLAAFVVDLPCVLKVRVEAFRVVVRIDEVVACVVRRVDVDHLHLAKVRLLEQL